MQGTIKEFDHATRTGSLLTDDRREIGIDASSADASVRMLRPGQRVIFQVADSGDSTVARGLHLVTFEA